ncbi:MAG: site-2 protease family protein, partial [Parachlamydiaceae bacterium]
SNMQLEDILNDGRVLLTIQRGHDVLLARVPRVIASELKMDSSFKEELIDWQFEAELKGTKLQSLYALPYDMTSDAIIENSLQFIDPEKQLEAFPRAPFSALEKPLQRGDRVLAVDGIQIDKAYQLLRNLQTRHVNIMVQRDPSAIQKVNSKAGDYDFDKHMEVENIDRIAAGIGLPNGIKTSGNIVLLKPIVPKSAKELFPSSQQQAALMAESKERLREIELMEDASKRAQMLATWKPYEERSLLGLPYQDRKVIFNPTPTELFSSVFQELSRVFNAIFERPASRDWLSGPVGIVRAVHDSWMLGPKEVIFWLGVISLNLGALNLLPIPVLDGGTIVLSFFELFTRRRIKPKTLERLVFPFALLLIGFFVYVTYNDILRVLGLWN